MYETSDRDSHEVIRPAEYRFNKSTTEVDDVGRIVTAKDMAPIVGLWLRYVIDLSWRTILPVACASRWLVSAATHTCKAVKSISWRRHKLFVSPSFTHWRRCVAAAEPKTASQKVTFYSPISLNRLFYIRVSLKPWGEKAFIRHDFVTWQISAVD